MVAAGSLPWLGRLPSDTPQYQTGLPKPEQLCEELWKILAPETHTRRFWSQLSAVRPEHLFAIGFPGLRIWVLADASGSEERFRKSLGIHQSLVYVMCSLSYKLAPSQLLKSPPFALAPLPETHSIGKQVNSKWSARTGDQLGAVFKPLSRCPEHLGGFSRSPPVSVTQVLSVVFLKIYCGHRSARNPAHVQVLIQPFFSKAHSFASNKLQNVTEAASLQTSLVVLVVHPLTCSERLTAMTLLHPLTIVSHKMHLEVQQSYV